MIRTTKIVFMCLGLFAISTAAPVSARAGVLEFFFPTLKEQEPDPALTMKAPFAPESAGDATVAEKLTTLPENALPLDKRHRANAEIGAWVMTAVSETMAFNAQDYRDDLTRISKNFDATGQQEYSKFLTDSGLEKALQTNNYYIRSFVQDTPLLLNEGVVDGTYRWLYEVPVMITYMDRGMTTYKKAAPVSQELLLTVQAGRVAQADNEHDILIERWSGKVQPAKKKK